ncbi:OsmC family protein [Terrihabitans sp. B22-R8]|uniref:OsmC family protein n=1 Tax=Terrihabitans sp. B22-R8 TaxID=3425128 RepID=UPI00403D399E
MSTLPEYLHQKRAALQARREKAHQPGAGPFPLSARASAEGRSGVRRIRIRDFQVISDSPPDFAGYDLGPSSPELLLGALSSCLTHTYLIQAADLGIPLEAVSVEVDGRIDPRGGSKDFDAIPVYPHDLSYRVTVTTDVEDLAELNDAVARFCPILNLLRRAIDIPGEVRRLPASGTAPALSGAA